MLCNRLGVNPPKSQSNSRGAKEIAALGKVALMAGALLLQAALCAAAPAADSWVLPNFAQRLDLTVTNPSSVRLKTLVTLPVRATRRLALTFPGSLAIAVEVNPPGSEYHTAVLPSQVDDLNGDGLPDEFEFLIALNPHQSKQVDIYYSTTLRGRITYPRLVHASHNYGYNHQTAALESEVIGYRTYGAFLLDVEGRVAGHPGLFNDLNGYLIAHGHFAVGKDILHVGDTLGLGGIFVERAGAVYRPPMNVPDYAHRLAAGETPRYRVLADGPLRAVIEATLEHWRLGGDEVAVRAWYTMDAGERFVRCRVRLTPEKVRPGTIYRVGAGLRELPAGQIRTGAGYVALSGEQKPQTGRVALALYFNPKAAALAAPLATPDGKNQVILFHQPLACGHAVEIHYAVAADWQKGRLGHLLDGLAALRPLVRAQVGVSNEHFEKTPHPERIEGEAR